MEKMKSASHIVLIEDYEVVEEKERMGWKIYIRMELLTNLQDVIKAGKMDTQGVVKMAEDVLTGLEFCHEVNLLHRDIKPGNIFVSEFGEYKIGDFGISREVGAKQQYVYPRREQKAIWRRRSFVWNTMIKR